MFWPRNPLLTTILVLLISYASTWSHARALDRRTQMYFRELIIQGERPEIVSCLVAATAHVQEDPRFDAIRWQYGVSEKAYLNESESGPHLKRIVRFEGEARLRESTSILETWRAVEVLCDQLDEQAPRVRLQEIVH